ncbi:hypothetical protein M514_08628 [Trichuris suis]|uniref:Uncharacterized protein n=1 Tax=Trichuris suis TaxID=68888 RepID=A0A085N3K4_9BILA|nr:hypothetical protein M513_08628 [Trichuris suis]KFD64050.1 hypothetical protein M514_08628 [Trichuris suis]
MSTPSFYLDPAQPDTILPVFTASDFLEYLGVEFNPFGGRRDEVAGALRLLNRACKAHLKPQQKIKVIRSHLLLRGFFIL